tara:strand:- start:8701 stop:10257 length:1557 start_codon:yes stop_codon:yes gene_type:complete
LSPSEQEIALEVRQEIGTPPANFSDIATSGPYINFFTNRQSFSMDLVNDIIREKDNYGKVNPGKKQLKTMVEFAQPNTNKPLHIGHLRNMAIGEAVSKISEFNGEKIIRANLNNDRGIHICKSMAAYEKFGKKSKPGKIKSDHFVGKYYVMFGQKSKKDKELELFSHRLLQEWETGNKKVVKLWEKMNKWALDGFAETFKKYDIKFDVEYYESKLYKHGKEIILKGVKDKIFEKRKDGAIIINLDKGLGEKVLLRMDGTSVYVVQDLYLAQLKFKDYKLDKSYYVVGNEQEYHFKVLFKVLEKLGFKQNMKHLAYGMVELPSGKIKSREGTKGITADEIIDNVQDLVRKELKKRSKLSKKELENRSRKITLGAIKYFLLKVDTRKNMLFNPKKAISFEGDTGPYIQYSYARASSIIKKEGKEKKKPKFNLGELTHSELELIKKLSQFKEVSDKAYKNLNPSVLANYSYQLSQRFNEFYHSSKVIGSDEQVFRLKLVEAFRQVLKNSLSLIGIDVLEEM